MKSATTITRTVGQVATRAIAAPKSRIPHLEWHILRKQRTGRPQAQLRRCFHTYTGDDATLSWPNSQLAAKDQPAEETPSPSVETLISTNDHPRSQSADLDVLAQSSSIPLPEALRRDAEALVEDAVPERTLAWLADHEAGSAFTQSASPAEFARLFTSISPDHFLDAFKRADTHARGIAEERNDTVQIQKALVTRLVRFVDSINVILDRRQETRFPLDLDICRHALWCAAATGDLRSAARIVDSVMPAYEIDLDIECYNHFLGALCHNKAFSRDAKTVHRMTPRNFNMRGDKVRRKAKVFLDYVVSKDDPEPSFTLRGQALHIFQTISEKALVTNEQTFTNLIIALARAADVAGVDSILRSVWNIDVNALEKFDEEELESPTFYEDGHPLRPTQRLLFAIVYAYGINNDMAKATSILDYTSRNYAIDIPVHVWEELFNWNFVIAKHRTPANQQRGQDAGQMPLASLETLFHQMTDEPYNIKPSIRVLDLLARNFVERDLIHEVTTVLRKINLQITDQTQLVNELIHQAEGIQKNPKGMIVDGLPTKDFFIFCRQFQLQFLELRALLGTLRKRLHRVLVAWRDRTGNNAPPVRHTLEKQALILEFQSHLPEFVMYGSKTGTVQLFRPRGVKASDPARWTLAKASFIWQALDTNNSKQLVDNLVNLPTDLSSQVYDLISAKQVRDTTSGDRFHRDEAVE